MTQNWMNEIGREHRFRATYQRQWGRMLVLQDVERIDGEVFRDHLHVRNTRRFRKLRLRRGDVLTFRGKVNRYRRKHDEDRHLPRHRARLVEKKCITNIHIEDVERK